MENLKKISKIIKKANSIAIFTHISPDFDALCSSMSLCLALKKIGKKADVFVKEELTDNHKLLLEGYKYLAQDCNVKDYDLFIATDVSAFNRLGDYADIFRNEKNTMILDHHICTDYIAKYNFINDKSSSCSEIVFKLIKTMKITVDNEMATLIYAGLSADCGTFKNTNTNAESFLAAYELTNLGADVAKVNKVIYESKTLKDIEFEKYLLNHFKVKNDYAYCTIDFKTLKEMNGEKADCQHYSRELISIEGVNRSFSLVEAQKGIYSLSLRAKKGFNVQKVAVQFGGGGHIAAAGATFEAKNMTEAKKAIIAELEKQGE